jgi:hypothetical protein
LSVTVAILNYLLSFFIFDVKILPKLKKVYYDFFLKEFMIYFNII